MEVVAFQVKELTAQRIGVAPRRRVRRTRPWAAPWLPLRLRARGQCGRRRRAPRERHRRFVRAWPLAAGHRAVVAVRGHIRTGIRLTFAPGAVGLGRNDALRSGMTEQGYRAHRPRQRPRAAPRGASATNSPRHTPPNGDVLCIFGNPGKWLLHCHTLAHQASGMKNMGEVA